MQELAIEHYCKSLSFAEKTSSHRDAELLSEAIDAGLSGRQNLAEALGGYEQVRNAESLQIYKLNYQLASLDRPSPEMLQLLSTLRGNQAETNRFFAALAGTIPISEFFTLEHIL
jgi:hypothetical protein